MSQLMVRYFAAAAETAGVDQEAIDLGTDPTLKALRDSLVDKYGTDMAKVIRAGSFLVDGTVRRDDGKIVGDTVDVLPPFAGG